MSPEQARGGTVDQRSDVWAFGCVLYEMLTGSRACHGETVSDVISAVLERAPDWEALPLHTPTSIRRLLRRCLEKDRGQRLRNIGDTLADIDDASNPEAREVSTHSAGRPALLAHLALLATTAVATAITTGVIVANRTSSTEQRPTRLTVAAPPGAQIAPAPPVLSPDGRTLVFVACVRCDTDDLDDWVVYQRRLDQLQAVPIPDARGAFFFFFSPDGRWLGLCTREGLKKVSLEGGRPVALYEGPVIGADWGTDDAIVFASPAGLMRLSGAGGTPQQITRPGPGKLHVWPAMLPSGSGLLYTVWEGSTTAGAGQIAVASLKTREERILAKGSAPRFLRSGHVIFGREGSLWAVPFDPRRLVAAGEAVPVVEGPTFSPQFGLAVFTIAQNGTLAYVTGDLPKPHARTLAWVSRKGVEEPLHLPPALYGWARVSPDGATLALDLVDNPGRSNIWIYDLARDTLGKLTDDPSMHLFPIWTRDGERVIFTSGPPLSFSSQRADGTGPAQHIGTIGVPGVLAASSWSPDGKLLVFNYLAAPRLGESAPFDIGMLAMTGNSSWKPLLHTEAAEVSPAISPDGAWIAYSSNRTGRFEIYVERFPDLGARQIVSIGGGGEPLWSANGQELFYRSLDGRQLLAVRVDPQSGRPQGGPTVVFEGPYASYLGGLRLRTYDVSRDGSRFIMLKELPGTGRVVAPSRLNVVLNWKPGSR